MHDPEKLLTFRTKIVHEIQSTIRIVLVVAKIGPRGVAPGSF
jgi:hypothetical protein